MSKDRICCLDVDDGIDKAVIMIGVVGTSLAVGMILLKILGIT